MSPLLREFIECGAVAIASVVLAFAARKLINVFARRMYRLRSKIGGDLLRTISLPVFALILLVGAFVAMGQLNGLSRVTHYYANIFQVAGVLIVLLGLTSVANLLIVWFSRKTGAEAHYSHFGLLKKLIILAVWILGSIQMLSILGVKVTAVLASLGVAGLAVGLALQDTIANLFAGFYLVADRSVSAGDYIKLESGEEGFVESVGWRNTRIRLWANNTVLIPNAKLTQSVITNMTLPDPVLSVYTFCGVGYDSDLELVESTALEVAREVLRSFPGGDLSFEPVLRYKEFGDSNIKFVVVFRVTEVGAQYLLQHEYIKALHKCFRERNIDISYPVRKLVWASESMPMPGPAPTNKDEDVEGLIR
jgi:small-conductance mechanosensitive channel